MFNIMNMCSISMKKKANIRPDDDIKIVRRLKLRRRVLQLT